MFYKIDWKELMDNVFNLDGVLYVSYNGINVILGIENRDEVKNKFKLLCDKLKEF